jgi:hypothetical protein
MKMAERIMKMAKSRKGMDVQGSFGSVKDASARSGRGLDRGDMG